MQNKRTELIKLLMNCLSYCYCDNCKYGDYDTYGEEYCENCYRKYSSWALGEKTATQIIDRILLELGVTVDAE